MIQLKEISILDENMQECIALEVLPEQRNFVASNALSLAEAYDVNKAYTRKGEGDIAVPYAVYENGKMVGFVMYGYFPPGDNEDESYNTKEHHYYVWRLFIDKNHQGRGIGTEILRQVMDIIKTRPHGDANYCYSSYDPPNVASQATFRAYGYKEDGRVNGGETVAVYKM